MALSGFAKRMSSNLKSMTLGGKRNGGAGGIDGGFSKQELERARGTGVGLLLESLDLGHAVTRLVLEMGVRSVDELRVITPEA